MALGLNAKGNPKYGANLWDDVGVIIGTGWTDLGGGSYQHTPGGADTIRDDIGLVTGATYLTRYTISGRTAGTVGINLGGAGTSTVRSSNGTFEELLVSTVNPLAYFQPDAPFDGTISAVIIRLQRY